MATKEKETKIQDETKVAEKIVQTVAQANAAIFADTVFVSVFDLQGHAMNPRFTENLDLDELVASYKNNGYDAKYPVLVHVGNGTVEKPYVHHIDMVNGKAVLKVDGVPHVLLKGHRRVAAAKQLKAIDEKTFNAVFPEGLIPVQVVANWSEDRQLAVLHDHDNREKPLTPEEKIFRVAALDNGIRTQVQITAILGHVSRGSVQQWARLKAMPAKVKTLVREGKLHAKDIKPLFDAGKIDAGGSKGEFKAGDKFKAALDEALTNPGVKVSTAVSGGEAVKHAAALAETAPSLASVLSGFADKTTADNARKQAAEIESRLAMLQRAVELLQHITGKTESDINRYLADNARKPESFVK